MTFFLVDYEDKYTLCNHVILPGEVLPFLSDTDFHHIFCYMRSNEGFLRLFILSPFGAQTIRKSNLSHFPQLRAFQ